MHFSYCIFKIKLHSMRANPIKNEKHFIIYSTGPMVKIKCAFIFYINIILTKGMF
jgi:hypothetical protein